MLESVMRPRAQTGGQLNALSLVIGYVSWPGFYSPLQHTHGGTKIVCLRFCVDVCLLATLL